MGRMIDADALKEYIHNQDGRPFIGITIGEAFQMMVDEQPTIEERKTGDLISRQAAIDAFANEKNNENTPTADRLWIRLGLERTCEILRELPSAQPEKCEDCRNFNKTRLVIPQPEIRKGKWIGGELGYCTCCGHEGCASDMWDRCEKPHCPNCGAEMEGVKT